MDPEIMEQLKAGKPVQFPKDTKIVPCLLRKETGEQALPIFTSPEQIPEDIMNVLWFLQTILS